MDNNLLKDIVIPTSSIIISIISVILTLLFTRINEVSKELNKQECIKLTLIEVINILIDGVNQELINTQNGLKAQKKYVVSKLLNHDIFNIISHDDLSIFLISYSSTNVNLLQDFLYLNDKLKFFEENNFLIIKKRFDKFFDDSKESNRYTIITNFRNQLEYNELNLEKLERDLLKFKNSLNNLNKINSNKNKFLKSIYI